MIQNKFVFPNFESGQFLTNVLLNNSFGYVEEQNRISRVQLIGKGVVEGLAYEYANDTLTIKSGTAITSDGFLVYFPEDKKYTFATDDKNVIKKSYPGGEACDQAFAYYRNLIEYVFYEDESVAEKYGLTRAAAPTKVSDAYDVALVVDFHENSFMYCYQFTCDRTYVETQVDIRPVLVKKNQFPVLYRRLGEIGSHIPNLKQMTEFESSVNINVLSARTAKLCVENASLIYDHFVSFVGRFTVYDVEWEKVLPNYKRSKLHECWGRFRSIIEDMKNIENSGEECPQFFLLFLEDMRNAINEFIVFYNSVFRRRYPFLRTGNEMVDRFVVVGPSLYGKEEPCHFNQYLFMPACVDMSYKNSCEVLSGLIDRICHLCKDFLGFRYGHLIRTPDFSLCCSSTSTLGEKPIPFYYDKSSLQPYWNPFSNYMDECFPQKMSLINKEPDQILFQDCYGKDVDTVKSGLVKFLADKGIKSVDVETFSLGKRRLNETYYAILKPLFDANGGRRKIVEAYLSDLATLRNKYPKEFSSSIVVLNERNNREYVDVSTVPHAIRNGVVKSNSLIRKKGTELYLEKVSESSAQVAELKKVRGLQRETLSSSVGGSVSKIPAYIRTNAATILKVAKFLSFQITGDSSASTLPQKEEMKVYLTPKMMSDAVKKAHDADSVSEKEYNMLSNVLKNVTRDDFIAFYEYIRECLGDKQGVGSAKGNVLYTNKYFASFLALKSYFELGYAPKYADACYCGGAKPESKIVLFYHKTEKQGKRFILELCMKKV